MSISQADGGTRSGLLWEVERILTELSRERESMPQILICENVPQIMSDDVMPDLQKWCLKLEELGYTSYYQMMNAKDFGIAQNRNRFFMVSLLGDYSYEFPSKIKLNHILKDFLEKETEEKYYLTEQAIERISKWKAQQDPLKDIDKEKEICPTLTARGAGEEHSGMVLINENLWKDNEIVDYSSSKAFFRNRGCEVAPTLVTHDKFGVVEKPSVVKVGNYSPSGHNAASIVSPQGLAPTVMENHGTVTAIPIKNNTKKGFLMAEEGDAVDISGRMQYHRGTVQKGLAQTLCTQGGENVGVVVEDSMFSETEKQLFTEDGNIRRYIGSDKIDEFKEGQMATTTYPNGYGHGPRTHNESIALNTIDRPIVKQNLRIRKLTPTECMFLMGFEYKDAKAMYEWGLAGSKVYHCAGDGIVTTVLLAIMSMLFDRVDTKKIINDYVEKIINNKGDSKNETI